MHIQDVQSVKVRSENNLLSKANVISVGIGHKKVKGEKTEHLSILVGVTKKLPESHLLKKEVIPQALDGVTVDIIELGNIRPFQSKNGTLDPTKRYRPIVPGTSVAHKNVSAGTVGCFAKFAGRDVILSNNHVLSDCNKAEIGDEIWQPGSWDGGTSTDIVGTLIKFIPLKFGLDTTGDSCTVFNSIAKTINFIAAKLNRKHRLNVVDAKPTYNEVDAAIASVDVDFVKKIPEIGDPVGIQEPELDMEVQKFGRTTSYTTGTIEQIDATISLPYDAGGASVAYFSGQIILSAMSNSGDSGSAIVSMDNNLIGLLFAGSETVTIASPMSKVFSLLNLTL